MFRSTLESRLLNSSKKSKAGAKPFDVVIMFKILILQRYYNLVDRQVEYQIVERSSFKKFLGLETGEKVPDEKTVWSFCERLTQSGTVEDLFERYVYMVCWDAKGKSDNWPNEFDLQSFQVRTTDKVVKNQIINTIKESETKIQTLQRNRGNSF